MQTLSYAFLGREIESSDWELQRQELMKVLGLNSKDGVVSLKQVHGTEIVELDPARPPSDLAFEADGLAFCALTKPAFEQAYIIKSADCVPLILQSGDFVCMIHAGWRGLASGIVQRGLERLKGYQLEHDPKSTAIEPREVCALIGPAADQCCYQVGSEVIEAIGDSARCSQSDDSKYMLSTGLTAEFQIREWCRSNGFESLIQRDPRCTICSPELHSYRRDGSSAGRNIAYVKLSAST